MPYEEFGWKVAQGVVHSCSCDSTTAFSGFKLKMAAGAEPVLMLGVGTDLGFTYERGSELLERCSVRLREPSDGAIIWSSNRPDGVAADKRCWEQSNNIRQLRYNPFAR